MANSVAHARLPYPVRGARFTFGFDFANPDAASPTHDTEVSKDGGAYTDAAEEATAITGGNSAWVTLTGAETDAAMVKVQHKTGIAGFEPPITTLYPVDLATVLTGNAQAGSTTTLQLAAGTFSTEVNAYAGMILKSTGGSGGGGSGGADNQAVWIETSDSDGTLHFRDVETAFGNDTDYVVGLPVGAVGDQAGIYSLIKTKMPNTLSLDNINEQVDTALADIGLDHLIATSESGANVQDNSLWARLTSATGSYADYDFPWHSLAGLANVGAMVRTVISSLTSQTLFQIANAAPDSGVYENRVAIITDAADRTKKAIVEITSYDGPDGEITLAAAPAFTIAVNDVVTILNAPSSRALRVEMDTSSTQLAAIVADTAELQTDWVNGGRLDQLVDGIKAKTDLIPAAPAAVGNIPTEADIVAELLGTEVDGVTIEQAVQILLAPAAGEVIVDVDAGSVRIRNLQDTVDRITADVEASGNRNNIVFDHGN